MQKFMQLKDYLLELSFLALLVRIIILGAGMGEALALISLVLSMAYTKWLAKEKIEQYEQLKTMIETSQDAAEKKFEQIFAKFNAQNMEQQLKREKTNVEQGQVKKRIF